MFLTEAAVRPATVLRDAVTGPGPRGVGPSVRLPGRRRASPRIGSGRSGRLDVRWTMTDLAWLTATELVAAYRDGSVSPVEATRAALTAIDAGNVDVNAFVLVDPDEAMAAAERSAARWRSGRVLGPADGVPTSIKDLLYTRGWPTLRGSS